MLTNPFARLACLTSIAALSACGSGGKVPPLTFDERAVAFGEDFAAYNALSLTTVGDLPNTPATYTGQTWIRIYDPGATGPILASVRGDMEAEMDFTGRAMTGDITDMVADTGDVAGRITFVGGTFLNTDPGNTVAFTQDFGGNIEYNGTLQPVSGEGLVGFAGPSAENMTIQLGPSQGVLGDPASPAASIWVIAYGDR